MNIPGALVTDVKPAPLPTPPKGQISDLEPGYEFINGEGPMSTPAQVEGSARQGQNDENINAPLVPQHDLTATAQFESSEMAQAVLEGVIEQDVLLTELETTPLPTDVPVE